jgi:ABC-type glycerol-3-phosphate transport system substrate-binding protein
MKKGKKMSRSEILEREARVAKSAYELAKKEGRTTLSRRQYFNMLEQARLLANDKRAISRRAYLAAAGGVVAVAVIGGVAYYLSTAGPTPTPTPVGPTPTPTPVGPTPTPTPTEVPYKGMKLRLTMMAGYPETPFMPDLIRMFKDATGIEVEFDYVPYGETLPKHMSLLATRSDRYQIYHVDSPWFPQYVPFLTPLDEFFDIPRCNYVPGDPDTDGSPPPIDDWEKPAIYDFGWAGGIYSLPGCHCYPALIYRTDILDYLGYKDAAGNPKPPANLDEYFAVAEDITKRTKGTPYECFGTTESGKRTGLGDEINNWNWGMGGEYFTESLEPAFGEQMLYALTKYQELYVNGYVPPGSSDYEIGEAAAAQMTGLAAMSWNWSLIGMTMEDPSVSKYYGKFDYQYFPGGSPSHGWTGLRWERIGSIGFCIPRWLPQEQKEAAYLFCRWFTTAGRQWYLAKGGFSTTPRTSIFESEEYRRLKDKGGGLAWKYNKVPYECNRARNGKGVAHPTPKVAEWSELDNFAVADPEMLCQVGSITPEECLSRMKENVRKTMQEGGYYVPQYEGGPLEKYPLWVHGRWTYEDELVKPW